MYTRIRTGDGRGLVAEEWGNPSGTPVLLLHGTPGSRLGTALPDVTLRYPHVRFIAYDRPGYGDSDRLPGRRVADAARDAAAVADALGVERFAVVGRSGGAPHALACAALLPGRVLGAAALVSLAPRNAPGLDWFDGMTPSNVREYAMASDAPDLLAGELAPRAEAIRRDPVRLIEEMRAELSDHDVPIVSDPRVRASLLDNYREALRTSHHGWFDDSVALAHPWGFDLSAISGPVMLWHGQDDGFSPVGHTRWLADRIEGAELVLEPDAGHFAAQYALPRVLDWLLDAERTSGGGVAGRP
ncbi:alpha/beta fold hydrolase [Streptomyces purpureus]|uniref:Alpha/beta hydrolase n=1 Tax=Streptomyces purpureus TaxID=1951 RepID=A0A918H5X7_9ACTN|nr:alpha/beta hydrolase [Streptomyces purpureus]